MATVIPILELWAERARKRRASPEWQQKQAELEQRKQAERTRLEQIQERKKRMNAPIKEQGPGVYWLCDQSGNPFYIGHSKDMRRRIMDWRREREVNPEWQYAIERQWKCGNKEAAKVLEERMIDTHDPPWNKQKWKPKPLGEVG